MKLGVVGLPNVGKSTLFNAITNAGAQAAGTEVTVTDADGKTVIYEKVTLDFEVVVVSSPEIVKGQTYNVKIGNQSGSFTAK